ncbi:chromate efflux transporter [Vreelandella neptunia]|uniref:Chromate efflux transporter n=1 Tax=Vreelandella neptunia TaxID=115551 RepID=A0ABS9SB38_9GAMM|nr:chromate efflux transporter [Halomonas neptunia]MCH4813314.1 chromate efflux transporter [Halomonas neptunia]
MVEETQTRKRIAEVFWAFLALGLTSFGGPVAHLGYFRTAFVERRQWLSENAYADLVALCQFLPGPASSQVGFALGLLRAGPWGAAMAWLAFTLPSAIILLLFALGAAVLDGPIASGIIHGLKVVAVAIVAHAVWGMARNLCPDKTRAGIALAAVFTVVLVSGPLGQVAAIVLGGLVGLALCRNSAAIGETAPLHFPVSRRAGMIALGLFGGLLVLLPLMAGGAVWLNVIDAFYRSGALVFGGGHVVLPLLEAEVVQSGWITPDEFLAGYGAAQAVPGPLFTFAAYLGALLPGMNGVVGALLALLAIFIPGFLLLVGVLPFWNQFRRWGSAQALMRGANAAVVGILGAALYQPVWISAIIGAEEFALALTGFLLLTVWKLPVWIVVAIVAFGGVAIAP